MTLSNPDSGNLPSLAPGTVFSHRYRLDAELGRGGMGIVYRATDLELRREVAVKVLTEAGSSTSARERLLHEARAAAALNHPNIVTVFDVGEDSGVPFFVMEFVHGETLEHARPAEIDRIVALACQACHALDHAHLGGFVHRDLKPGNLLVSGSPPNEVVKLADLGLAIASQSSERITEADSFLGTAAYMAPEQALGESVDGRADLYSLGVILYELTTGRLPFTGDNALAIVSQHVHAPVAPPRALNPRISSRLESVILRLLAKDPAQRFATARETMLALEASMIELPDAAPVQRDAEPVQVLLLNALARGRLVGRQAEFLEAQELWRRARDGAGHCVLLSGEPGAGKTRLARELLVRAAVDGAAVLSGACYEFEATTPYLPFVEAFRRWVREQPDDTRLRELLLDSAGQLSRLAPDIETRLGHFPNRVEMPPHEERLLFFDAVAQACRSIARSRGLLLYVDDLHWADASSLGLLSHLLRSLREDRVLFAASYRETELDRAHPLAKALVDWNRERLITRIMLRRFGPRETQAQLSALLGEEAGTEFSEAVHRETEGNPFFVEEVLKSLIEKGSVRREHGRWKKDETNKLVIPQSVKEAIGHRLNRATPECNDVLRTAAVIGKTFDFQELAVADDHGEDALLDALDEAIKAQLIVAGKNEEFSFTHDKIREVLYEELNPIRRRRLHKRVAEGLERMRPAVHIAVEKLAHHYHEAGDHRRGLGYAKEAGLEAVRSFAYDEAIAAYGHALDCAEVLGLEAEQASLEEAMGDACISSGDHLPAARHFERALALTHEPAVRARLQCAAASSLVTLGDPRGLTYVRQALEVLDPAVAPFDTAHALAIEGRFHHLAGRHAEAVTHLKRAAAIVEPLLDGRQLSESERAAVMHLYLYLAGAYQHLGLFADADAWARCSIDFGTAHRIPSAQAAGYEFLGENAVSTGEWRAGLEYAALEREIASRIQSRERMAWSYLVTCCCSYLLGEFAKAETAARDGIALADISGERRLAALLISYHVLVLTDLGRTEEALGRAAEAMNLAESLDLLYLRTEAHRAMAHVHRARGELDNALEHCECVLRLTSTTDAKVSRLLVGPLHIETLLAAGRKEEALARLADYAALTAECQSPYFARRAIELEELVR